MCWSCCQMATRDGSVGLVRGEVRERRGAGERKREVKKFEEKDDDSTNEN